ncbi:MAG: PhoX family protein [Candidatus Nitrosocosmicus sp.]|nr:PhoX family protein [Candidatus Nitrosocosmicus sp.]MDN5867775.1 PhoX family protein [Candidatus Nitrosocosmicus sp.]
MQLTIITLKSIMVTVIVLLVTALPILVLCSMSNVIAATEIASSTASNETFFMLNGSHLTTKPAFISFANNTDLKPAGEIKPLITSGENLSNGFSFSGIPDGLGAIRIENETVDVYVNHEYDSTEDGQYAKVSKLRLNTTDGSVVGAKLAITGSQGYERLCSASLVEGYGFEHPIFLTNEEIDDGLVIAIDAINGTVYELPWLGLFSHENTIHVPYFYENANKTVVLEFEDGDETESEVYMYVADTPNDLLTGRGGQLHVFGAVDNSTYNTWDDIYYNKNETTVNGKFIPLSWNYLTQNETALDTEAIEVGGFQFIRPEDGAMDKRLGKQNILYMADTGGQSNEDDEIIPPGSNGQNWTDGRIYQFEFMDPLDPTEIGFRVMFDGNDPMAPGYQVLTNPDNMDTSLSSIMINEDRIDANTLNTTSPYNVTLNAQILRVDLSNPNSIIPIAYVNQIKDKATAHGEWESSGILDISRYFGDGAWLVDVQAHTIDEGGQLLLLKIPES